MEPHRPQEKITFRLESLDHYVRKYRLTRPLSVEEEELLQGQGLPVSLLPSSDGPVMWGLYLFTGVLMFFWMVAMPFVLAPLMGG